MHATEKETTLRQFFEEYEAGFNRALAHPPQVDAEATASAFADCFLEASPAGINCSRNDEQFRAVIPQGYKSYRSIGTKSMKIINFAITPLDDFHFMVRVSWHASYVKNDGSSDHVDFDVIYFAQILKDQPKIFMFITGDEQKIYQERGLEPYIIE